jgi:hypothetical protein
VEVSEEIRELFPEVGHIGQRAILRFATWAFSVVGNNVSVLQLQRPFLSPIRFLLSRPERRFPPN